MSGLRLELRRYGVLASMAACALLIGCAAGAGGGGGGGEGGTDGGGGEPVGDEFTFGAVQPDVAMVDARPASINPYAANRTAAVPGSVDLSDGLPPIGDQGAIGSCLAWAAGYGAATFTANRQYGWGQGQAGHQASPGYLYSVLIETDNLDCGGGTFIQTAMDQLIQKGCSSFETQGYSDSSCETPIEGDAANFRIGSYNRVDYSSQTAMKGELAGERVVVVGMGLDDNFTGHTGSGVYVRSGTPLLQDSLHAAHAVLVVGYDDTRGAYRIMNSWGTSWGDSGFMWMEYATFEQTVFEAYSIEPAAARDPVDPTPGPDDDDEGTIPTDDPEGQLGEAFQFADFDFFTGQDVVYLIFFYDFDAPVFIRSITVTDPLGGSAVQEYNSWYADGYVYFVRDDGFQWTEGVYSLEFDTQTLGGNDIIYFGEAQVGPLGEDVTSGLCDDSCIFAFDGECDDGGSGSLFNVCEYGSDCFDCGVRDAGTNGMSTNGATTNGMGTNGATSNGIGTDGATSNGLGTDGFGTDGFGTSGFGTDGFAKQIVDKPVRRFRGMKIKISERAKYLPAAGVTEGIRGANQQPAIITRKK